MHVLVVENDLYLGRGLRTALERWGHTSAWETDGASGLSTAKGGGFDMILLDLGLPSIGGTDVLRMLRQSGVATPVLVITARDTMADRVAGLDLGADDYLVKPFELDELSARMRALDRRARGATVAKLEVGKLVLEPAAHEAHYDGRLLTLSPTEFLLLRTLAERAGRVVGRDFLERVLYGVDRIESNALEVHVHSLRKKTHADFIRTARGLGYLVVNQASS